MVDLVLQLGSSFGGNARCDGVLLFIGVIGDFRFGRVIAENGHQVLREVLRDDDRRIVFARMSAINRLLFADEYPVETVVFVQRAYDLVARIYLGREKSRRISLVFIGNG